MITVSTTLPAEARKLREDVFIHEQGFQNEFDETDQSARHVVCWENGRAVGTCRFFPAEEPDTYYIGRMAVAKGHRHQQLGTVILETAEAAIKNWAAKKLCFPRKCAPKTFICATVIPAIPKKCIWTKGNRIVGCIKKHSVQKIFLCEFCNIIVVFSLNA